MSTELIIAAVVDTRLLTLYRFDGSTIEIPQGDPRIRTIVEQIMPVVEKGGIAEIDLTHLPNAYKDFEQKSSGIIRLFRVAKKAVTGLFIDPVEEGKINTLINDGGVIGMLPNVPNTGVSTQPPTKMGTAVDEILSQAQAVSDPEYKDSDTTNEQTMIAVVDNGKGQKTVIPGVEALKEQFNYSSRLGSTKGIEAFFQRLAPVMELRSHSVQDLLRFLERGDLPIADDGCIVAYKVLRRHNRERGIFVDCHTQNVSQRLNSYVCVDESLVDRNRHNECSNGLHIARRGYLGGFSGDVVTMCKIRPEDVITVPHRDANKIRVCGYHILFELSGEAFSRLRSNRPATDMPDVGKLLTRAINGNHPAPDQEVRITQQRGKGVVITALDKQGNKVKPAPEPMAEEQRSAPATKHVALDDDSERRVDPRDVASKVNETKAKGTRQEKAQMLWSMFIDTNQIPEQRLKSGRELAAFKKSAKVSWTVLGIPQANVELLEKSLVEGLKSIETPKPKAALKPKAAPAKVKAKPKPKAKQPKAPAKKRVKNSTPQVAAKITVAKATPKPSGSPVQQQARSLYAGGKFGPLLDFKQSKKKGWAALGFTSKEISEIEKKIKDLK